MPHCIKGVSILLCLVAIYSAPHHFLKNQLLAVIHKFKRAVSFNFLIERFSVFGRQSSRYFSEFSPYFHFRFGNNFRDMSQPNLQNVFACTNVLKKIFSWISESFLWISVIFVRSSVKPAESTSLPWPISIKSFLVKSLFFSHFFFFWPTISPLEFFMA